MTVSLYGTGVQGLLVAKQALDTVGHNISNVNTEGYSRQKTNVITAGGHQTGTGFVGLGSQVKDIVRVFDEFAYLDLQGNTSSVSYNEEFLAGATRVDQVISDDDTSITNALGEFFSAMNTVADNPNSLEARNNLLQVSGNLTSTFNRLHEQLEIQFSATNDDVENIANEMTALAENLANVNLQIQQVWGDGENHLPNDLLDQRDRIILRISEFTNVTTVDAGDGMLNLFIGTGQPLVLGKESLTVEAIPGRTDNGKLELALSSGGIVQRLRGDLMGGKIQAVYDVREQVLDPAFNKLGQTALGISHMVNEQQSQGLDMNMVVGTDFFNDTNSFSAMNERVMPTNDDLGTATLSVEIEDVNMLTADDFSLTVLSYTTPPESVQFQLTNLTSGEQLTLPAAGPQDLSASRNISVDEFGFSINVDSISATDPLQVGKRFEIRPTRMGASNISTEMIDPQLIAVAANQVLISDADTNTGSSTTRIAQLLNTSDTNFPTPEDVTTYPVTAARGIRIEITEAVAGTFTYDVVDSNTGALIEEPVGTPMTGLVFTPPSQTITHAGMEIEIEIEDTAILDSYSFTFDYNETGVGNNSNALTMAAFQTDKTLNGGRSTFQDNYALLTSTVGSITSSADVRTESALVLFDQANTRFSSIAGVNLDEEASNLLKYQTAYSAAAKVITVADELMQTLLNAVR